MNIKEVVTIYYDDLIQSLKHKKIIVILIVYFALMIYVIKKIIIPLGPFDMNYSGLIAGTLGIDKNIPLPNLFNILKL
jgi:hypothetical protein